VGTAAFTRARVIPRLISRRKVHFLLVSTLNAAFPDHDFTALRPDHFTREPSAAQVLAQLSGTLGPGPGPNTAP
jgi:hypothetical protein